MTLGDRVDRILELLDVGDQHTTPNHYGYPPSYDPIGQPGEPRGINSIIDECDWHDITDACIELTAVPIRRYSASVVLAPRHIRYGRRHPRTAARAVLRLANIYLRRVIPEDVTPIGDAIVMIDTDHTRRLTTIYLERFGATIPDGWATPYRPSHPRRSCPPDAS